MTPPIVLALVALTLVGVPTPAPGLSHPWSAAPLAPSLLAPVCNPANPSPSAVSIPTTNVPGILPAGGAVSSEYEVEAPGYNSSLGVVSLSIPSALSVFPLTPRGSLKVFLPPRTINLTSPGWSDPSLENTTATRSTNVSLTFSPSASATFSTQKIAVLVNRAYDGQLSVAFRWRWVAWPQGPNGTAVDGNWTSPASTAKSPALPSLFYPAPFVSIAGMSPWPAEVGSQFGITLAGAVSATTFRIVLEYPNNGTEVRSQTEGTPSGATSFGATIVLGRPTSGLTGPGTYLIHVHDVCGAIVRSLSIWVINDTAQCNQHTPSPAALRIPTANPRLPGRPGDQLQVVYQVRIVNYTASMGHVQIVMPSAQAVFPLVPRGSLILSIPSTNITSDNPNWQNLPGPQPQVRLSTAEPFDRNASAYLSTQKIAVEASGAYNGRLILAFHWQWKISGQPAVPWTTPSYRYADPFLPSIFYPAPIVPLLAAASNGTAGTNYAVRLGGAVHSTTFRVVLEYPNNGTEIRSVDEYTGPNASTFTATVKLALAGSNTLPNGTYLVHVHDLCDAILHSVSVHVTGGSGTSSPGFAPALASAPTLRGAAAERLPVLRGAFARGSSAGSPRPPRAFAVPSGRPAVAPPCAGVPNEGA